jgi:DNA-directed RNA polymerase subunit RPC12/RpoP
MIDIMMLYSCAICGETRSGVEWQECIGKDGKDFQCPSCLEGLNEDELYSEED